MPSAACSSRSELAGKRVGVRAYTVTTSTWVRGILAQDYGVDLDKVEWVTFEDPHVAEYRDPDTIKRAPPGKELVQMLLDGELDAAIVGDKLPDPRLRHLIPDPDRGLRANGRKSHGGVPINHMVVLREDIAKSRPDVAKELFRLLLASKRAAEIADRWHRARSAPLRGRGLSADIGDHHRLLRASKAHPAKNRGRCAVR